MNELSALSNFEYLAHIISLIGKGGAYILLCLLMSGYCIFQRVRSSKPILSLQLNTFEQMTWIMWSYWVFGTLLNQALKFTLAAPRPWWIDPNLPPLSPQPSLGFGMPSGHAQGAVGLWLLWYQFRSTHLQKQGVFFSLIYIMLALMCLLWVPGTMWARVTLHAHSFAQVCAGMSVGIVWASVLLWLTKSSRGVWILSALSILCLLVLSYHRLTPQVIPEAWLEVIQNYVHEPLWFKPKNKVLIVLSMASFVLIWIWSRQESTQRRYQ